MTSVYSRNGICRIFLGLLNCGKQICLFHVMKCFFQYIIKQIFFAIHTKRMCALKSRILNLHCRKIMKGFSVPGKIKVIVTVGLIVMY